MKLTLNDIGLHHYFPSLDITRDSIQVTAGSEFVRILHHRRKSDDEIQRVLRERNVIDYGSEYTDFSPTQTPHQNNCLYLNVHGVIRTSFLVEDGAVADRLTELGPLRILQYALTARAEHRNPTWVNEIAHQFLKFAREMPVDNKLEYLKGLKRIVEITERESTLIVIKSIGVDIRPHPPWTYT